MFWHIKSMAQQLIPNYNTTVHKNNNIIAHNVANLLVFWDAYEMQSR